MDGYVGKSSTMVEATVIQQDGQTASATASASAMITAQTANLARDKSSKLSQTLAQQAVNDILGPSGVSKTSTEVSGATGSVSTNYAFVTQVNTTQTTQ
jgi:hypothetical protein